MLKNHNQIWTDCLTIIKDNVQPISFRTWFEPIKPLKIENEILTIQVPSPFFYEYLEEQYIDILRRTLRKVIGVNAKLEYNVVMSNPQPKSASLTVNYPTNNNSKLNNRPVSIPLNTDSANIKNPFVIPGIQKLHIDPQLKKENTFENYVEGECNRLARSAGFAVAQNPGGTSFNPLLIYGDSGLGKTHLAQAIGIEVTERFPDKVILYVNAYILYRVKTFRFTSKINIRFMSKIIKTTMYFFF